MRAKNNKLDGDEIKENIASNDETNEGAPVEDTVETVRVGASNDFNNFSLSRTVLLTLTV